MLCRIHNYIQWSPYRFSESGKHPRPISHSFNANDSEDITSPSPNYPPIKWLKINETLGRESFLSSLWARLPSLFHLPWFGVCISFCAWGRILEKLSSKLYISRCLAVFFPVMLAPRSTQEICFCHWKRISNEWIN